MNRTDPSELIKRLRAAGVWSKHSLGQHFLIDKGVLDSIVDSSKIESSDTILEIGPGPGVLTAELLLRAGKVVAVELDPDMADIIRQDFPDVLLYQGDAIRLLPEICRTLTSYKVVANIPYQITTPLLQLLLEGGCPVQPQSITILVQKEVGERITAPAGKSARGYLTILTECYSKAEYICTVPATAFWPAPAVQSAVIHLDLHTPKVPDEIRVEFLRFVKMSFKEPRKQLKNVISNHWGRDICSDLKALSLAVNVRAHQLTLEQWLLLWERRKCL